MRLGVVFPQARPWSELSRDFAWGEEVGYDVAYVYDHLTHPTAAGGWLAEGFTTLAAAAGVTTTIELGTLVASATLHTPVSLARLAATVDDVSGGRLVLGLGAGSPRCSMADRGEDPTPGEMHRRLVDVVEGMTAVFDGATEWTGGTRSFSGLQTTAFPDGASRPYLMLAAHGPRTIELAALRADAWNTYGGPSSSLAEPDDYWREVAVQAARMTEACRRVGRERSDMRWSLLLGYGLVRPTESAGAFVESAERAQALGFDELVVYGPGGPGERFTSDPAVHAEAIDRLKG